MKVLKGTRRFLMGLSEASDTGGGLSAAHSFKCARRNPPPKAWSMPRSLSITAATRCESVRSSSATYKPPIFAGTTSHPIGTQISLERDLGVEDSLTAGRINWQHRFNKRHAMSVEYYELSVEGVKQLSTEITIRDRTFPISVDVTSWDVWADLQDGLQLHFPRRGQGRPDGLEPACTSGEFSLNMTASGAVEDAKVKLREGTAARAWRPTGIPDHAEALDDPCGRRIPVQDG